MTSDAECAADGDPGALTSLHVRRAADGDSESLGWVVARLSPLLLAQADYRLGPVLRSLYDPEDLVNDTWIVALPRLPELPARDGRHALRSRYTRRPVDRGAPSGRRAAPATLPRWAGLGGTPARRRAGRDVPRRG